MCCCETDEDCILTCDGCKWVTWPGVFRFYLSLLLWEREKRERGCVWRGWWWCWLVESVSAPIFSKILKTHQFENALTFRRKVEFLWDQMPWNPCDLNFMNIDKKSCVIMLVLQYEHKPNPKKVKSEKLHVVWARYQSNKTLSEKFFPCLEYYKACIFQNKNKNWNWTC